ncbi:MAG: WD40 repeat domain-containing protein, partial [Microcystaceae cyanobacterium]
DLETGKIIHTLLGHENSVNSLSFNPDGKTLASGSDDKTIKVWDTITGLNINTFHGHDSYIKSLKFSPDGKILASGSSFDGTIKLWDMDLDSLMVRDCDWVRNYLTYNPSVSESDRHLCDNVKK